MLSTFTRAVLACALTALLGVSVDSVQAADELGPGATLDFQKDIQPLLKKYCLDCHSGADPEGKMRLDQLTPGGRKVRKEWQKVHDNLDSMLMPPTDAEQPTMQERKLLTSWMQANPLQLDCSGPTHPGRVTVRRLNRVEYNNTIRDLCGVDFKPSQDFPSDDVGYGFDNIGDVLSLPPILMEKYLEAADRIMTSAVTVWDESNTKERRKDGGAFGSVGEIPFENEFSASGEYIFRITARADQAGPEKAKAVMLLDKKELETFIVDTDNPADERTFEKRVQIEKGKHVFAVRFPNDYYDPKNDDPKLRGDRNLWVKEMVIRGPIGVKPDDLPASHKQIIFVEPSKELSDEQCAKQVLKRFASRAYRRPASDDDVARLMKIYEFARASGEKFERGIQLACQAVLVSPKFLFRIEQEPTANDPGGIRTLDEYELAVRLSYFLWSTMPDNELLLLAHQGKLRQNLEPQVKRMLQDPKAESLVDDFAGQWLQLRSLDVVSPGTKAFPNWNDDLRNAMRAETEMFFKYIVRQDRSVLEFLTADYTFLNETLAKHYGISDVKGSEFRKVSVNGDQRGGLLGQASILTVTSNPNRTSPVKRGKWILENLLASPPPPAPPNVPALEEGRKSAEKASLRKRLEMHRSNASCAACHKLLDPLGFGLENYDAVGAWRTKDGSFPVEPAGELPTGEKFNKPKELREILAKRENEFRRCLTEKLMTYGLGRGLELDDECTVRAVAEELKKNDNRFSSLVMAIVRTDQFQKRAAVRNRFE